jgi:hypothetical protein
MWLLKGGFRTQDSVVNYRVWRSEKSIKPDSANASDVECAHALPKSSHSEKIENSAAG